VTFACVDGRVLYRDRRLLSLDEAEVRRQAFGVREKLQARMREGVQVGAARSGWWRPEPSTDD